MVRAKFMVTGISDLGLETKNGEAVAMRAVYGGETNAEDNTFSEATPQAELTMTISNPDCFGAFENGKCYYADFTPAVVEPIAE